MKSIQRILSRSLVCALLVCCGTLQAIVVVYPKKSSTMNQNSIEKNESIENKSSSEFSESEQKVIKEALINFTWPRAEIFRCDPKKANNDQYKDLFAHKPFAEAKFIQKMLDFKNIDAVVTEVPNVIWDLYYIHLYRTDEAFKKAKDWEHYFRVSRELGNLIAKVDISDQQNMLKSYMPILEGLVSRFDEGNTFLNNKDGLLSLILAADIKAILTNQACFYRTTGGVVFHLSGEDLALNINKNQKLYDDYLQEPIKRLKQYNDGLALALKEALKNNQFLHDFCKEYFNPKQEAQWQFNAYEDAVQWKKLLTTKAKSVIDELGNKQYGLNQELSPQEKELKKEADAVGNWISGALSCQYDSPYFDYYDDNNIKMPNKLTETSQFALDYPAGFIKDKVFRDLISCPESIGRKELSYALTFLAGYEGDNGSCSYALYHNYINHKQPYMNVYAVFFDKKWAYTRGVYFLHLPKDVNPGEDVVQGGIHFHPRVVDSMKNGYNNLPFKPNPRFSVSPNSIVSKRFPELSEGGKNDYAFALEVAEWLTHSEVLAYKGIPLTETNVKKFPEAFTRAADCLRNQRTIYELLYTFAHKPAVSSEDLKNVKLKDVKAKENLVKSKTKESGIEIKKNKEIKKIEK